MPHNNQNQANPKSWDHLGNINGLRMNKKGAPSTVSVGQFVLLAFVDRDRDALILQTALKSEVMNSATAWNTRRLLIDHMENASGYGTVLSDSRNGDILFLVFREYLNNPWSDILFLRYPVGPL